MVDERDEQQVFLGVSCSLFAVCCLDVPAH